MFILKLLEFFFLLLLTGHKTFSLVSSCREHSPDVATMSLKFSQLQNKKNNNNIHMQ